MCCKHAVTPIKTLKKGISSNFVQPCGYHNLFFTQAIQTEDSSIYYSCFTIDTFAAASTDPTLHKTTELEAAFSTSSHAERDGKQEAAAGMLGEISRQLIRARGTYLQVRLLISTRYE